MGLKKLPAYLSQSNLPSSQGLKPNALKEEFQQNTDNDKSFTLNRSTKFMYLYPSEHFHIRAYDLPSSFSLQVYNCTLENEDITL